jgi:hypothetical protein
MAGNVGRRWHGEAVKILPTNRIVTGIQLNRHLALIGVLLLVLSACGKLTQENYNKITVGMSYDDVVQRIGSPTRYDDVMGLRHCSRGNDTPLANITFAGENVMLFASSNLN